MIYTLDDIDTLVAGKLVVSCQPVPGGALDDDETVVRFAMAAIEGGAGAIRLEGAARIAVARERLKAPIIGIVKRELAGFDIRITPNEDDVDALSVAGADIIAFDATARERPYPVKCLVDRIHSASRIAMADCATLADAKHALDCGCDIIGTTLAGYTGGDVPKGPDFELLRLFTDLPARVMAEGRYAEPAAVSKAKAIGAWAVTVGTAITRIEMIVAEYADALATTNMDAVNPIWNNKGRVSQIPQLLKEQA